MQAKASRVLPTGSWRRKEAFYGYLLASPWIIGFLIFTLGALAFFSLHRFYQLSIG